MTAFRPPNDNDDRLLRERRVAIQEILITEYCSARLLRSRDDLRWLQRVMNEEVLWPDQVDLLQAVGIAFGDVLISELDGYAWSRLEDATDGRLVLRWRETDRYFAGPDEVVRRVQSGASVDFWQMYDEAVAAVPSSNGSPNDQRDSLLDQRRDDPPGSAGEVG